MYGVQKPVEGDGYHPHKAGYDAELAGRLYFAMRGLRYKEPVKRVLRRLRTTPAATVTDPPPAARARAPPSAGRETVEYFPAGQ